MTCKLCGRSEPLRRSHIVPEFLYRDLYDTNRKMMGINGRGNRGWRPLQKGLREPLLCDGCEQSLNDRYEKPFLAEWVDAKLLPNPWSVAEPYDLLVSYQSFKLFHLSVLFRAAASSLPTFNTVKLSTHHERIRRMILDDDPGQPWEYPMFGIAVRHHRDNSIVPIITRPTRKRFEGIRMIEMAYAGVVWCILISRERREAIERISLAADGRLKLVSINWAELGVVKAASQFFK